MWLSTQKLIKPMLKTCLMTFNNSIKNNTSPIISSRILVKDFHLFTIKPELTMPYAISMQQEQQQQQLQINKLLNSTIILPQYQQTCGLKVKGKLRRRCKDCHFVIRQQRMYVICKTHPRHKQMSMKTKEKNTWILTHAMQSKVRPY